ncbi:MAG: hypothetical protein QF473_13765 [Planctomycetota bacterium]|nr:hypothetical protein [Planctomycetota bacterium]
MKTDLQNSFAQHRHRALYLGCSSGVCWGLLAFAITLLVGVWFDLLVELPPSLRFVAICAALAAFVCFCFRLFRRSFESAEDRQLARRLDSVGETGGEILSGYHLTALSADAPAVTRSMASTAVERASQVAGSVPPEGVTPREIVSRPAWMLAALFAAFVCFTLFIPRLVLTEWRRFADPWGDHPPYSSVIFDVEPGHAKVIFGKNLDIRVNTNETLTDRVELVLLDSGDEVERLPMFPEPEGSWRTTITGINKPVSYFVRAHSGRSHRYKITVVTVPRIEQVRYRVQAPAYTNLGATEGLLPRSGVAGLPGTKIYVEARSNRALRGGRLELLQNKERAVVDMQPLANDEMSAQATFEASGEGSLRLKVADTEGQWSDQEFSAPIILLTDERPFVRIRQPMQVSLATPDVTIPVQISAEDDYGVARVQLFRSLNRSRPLPMDLGVPEDALTRVETGTSLQLQQYGLQPGDEIRLFARVEDNDPAGAKGAESSIVVIRIISQEELQRLAMARQGMEMFQSKYDQARRRMEALAEEARKLREELAEQPDDKQLDEKSRRRLDELLRKMETAAEEMRKSSKLDLPLDLDKALTRQLERLAGQLDNVQRQLQQMAAQPDASNGDASKELEDIERQLAGQQRLYDENALEPIEHLAQIFPLIQDQARFTELYKRQRDLAERLSALEGVDNEDSPRTKARMRDLEDEQRNLREQLSDLLDDIDNHIKQLPEDKPELEELRQTAQKFLKDVRESSLTETMVQAEAGLAEFSGTAGYEKSREAEKIMSRFLSRCQGMAGQAEAALMFQPQLSQGLGNTIEQLLAAAGLESSGKGGLGFGTGGYSTRRSTLNNIGLYGSLPSLSPSQESASGGGKGGRGKEAWNEGGGRPGESNFKTGGNFNASGAGTAIVPVRYRKQVSEYFQRVVDDLGE